MIVSSYRRRQIGWFLAAILMTVCLYFLFRKGQSGAYQALPESVAIVLEFNGLVKGLQVIGQSPRPAWQQLSQSSLLRALVPDVDAAARIFRNDAVLKSAFLNQRLLAAFSLNQADSLHALFILEPETDFNLSEVMTISTEGQRYFPSMFHDQQVFTVLLPDGKRIVLTQTGNLLLFSRFSYLVEDALAQLESGRSWWTDRKFARQLPKEAPLKIQLHPEAWARHFQPSLAESWQPVADLLERNATWLGMALDGSQVVARLESKGFLSQLSSFGEAEKTEIFSILPENTAFLAWVGFANQRPFLNTILDEQTADFKQFILPWLGREAAYVITEPFSTGMQNDRYIVLGVRDTALATQRLRD
ncbi:MAG: hypothetical protein ABIO24_03140, partial [Saprospiraceae bacterium]